MTVSELHDAVRAALDAGLAVLPPMEDGSKQPIAKWKDYQSVAPTREQVREWYGRDGYVGLGVLTGAVSGGLEMLELEGRAIEEGLLGDLLTLAEATGLGELVARIEAGYTETTPSGGLHWLYRVDAPLGNTKLASRPATPQELEANPGNKIKVLIETRGEAGFVVTAPSNGRVHPSGGRWTLTAGGFATITTITPDERDALFDLCRALDRMPVSPPRPTQPATAGDGDRPGDRYNEAPDAEARVEDLLIAHGWTSVHQHQGITYLRRPGKDRGISATLGRHPGTFIVFSTSTEFEATAAGSPRGYRPFSVYAILEHGGDFAAAARALAANEPSTPIDTGPRLEYGAPVAAAAPSTPGEFPHLRDVFESLHDTTVYPFAVDRMLRLGYYALLAAYESTGKSYIATQLGVSVITARPVFGEFDVHEPMGVCVFDMEMGEGEDRNRDRQMMADMGIDAEAVRGLYRRITLDDVSLSLKTPDHVAYIGHQLDLAHADMDRPILAILDSTDSLLSKRPWGEDADTLDAAISAIREGRRDWLIIVLLIHTKKKPQDGKADYVRDLEDVIGNASRQADMVMVLDTRGELALRCGIYKRPGRSQGILQRPADGFAWIWTRDEGDTSTKVDPVTALETLRLACRDAANGRTTRAVMASKLGVTDTTIDKYLRDLESKGLAASTNEGTYKSRWEYWPVEGTDG